MRHYKQRPNINYTDQTLTINCVHESELDGKYRLRKKEKSETVIEDFFDAETLPNEPEIY